MAIPLRMFATTIILVFIAIFLYYFNIIHYATLTFDRNLCNINERCSDSCISTQFSSELKHAISKKLYGQHLAEEVAIRAIENRMTESNPKKALVLSFQGVTGAGKNYLTGMIATSMYKNGFDPSLNVGSSFVHQFVAPRDFPDPKKIRKYQDQIRNWIVGNISICERSLFIFDEVDKMPPALMDTIKPFVDYHEHIDGVNTRKSIFIFLHNNGGLEIANKTLELYKNGRRRESIQLEEIEPIAIKTAYNTGGLKGTDLINRKLIDYYLPFLPLEKDHIMGCIKDYLIPKAKFSYELAEDVLKEMTFYPPANPIFSYTGCKQVEEISDMMLNYRTYE